MADTAGRTGSGKTAVLGKLRQRGLQCLDLEGLARHTGSAFGRVGQVLEQPTHHNFENELGLQWLALDHAEPVFIEDEGVHIGHCQVPPDLWGRMRRSDTVLDLQVPREMRVARLVDDYARSGLVADPEWRGEMEQSMLRIKKRLGGQRLQSALDALHAGDFAGVASELLHYYDKTYDAGLFRNRDVHAIVPVHVDLRVGFGDEDDEALAQAVLRTYADKRT